MKATAKFAGMNDAYTMRMVDFISQMHSMQADLQRALAVVRDAKATAAQKTKAALKVAFTSTDMVRRLLSTADETWGTMIQDFVLRNEAMRQMLQKGKISPAGAAMLFAKASDEGRKAGDRHRNETGNETEALLVERDATQLSLIQSVKEVAGEDAAKDVSETSIKEGPMELGNRGPETSPMWDVPNIAMEGFKKIGWALRSIVPKKHAESELIGRLLSGFITVPANILNRSAYFSPIGIARALYKMGKLGGDSADITKAYEETMATEGQQRMRLIEGVTGTIGMLILAILTSLGDDDDAIIKITGNGPTDPDLRDAWLKDGNRPWHISSPKFIGDSGISFARGGLDHLNFPLTLFGVMDDMQHKHKKGDPKNIDWGMEYAKSIISGYASQARFFGMKNLVNMPSTTTDRSLASNTAYYAAPVIPWAGLAKSIGRAITGSTDQSSMRSAALAQLPVTNAFGRPAINMLGDRRGMEPLDLFTKVSDRAELAGFPLFLAIDTKSADADIYRMFLDRGVAPSMPLRSTLERKNGFLPDDRWEQYVKLRGGLIKAAIKKQMPRFRLMQNRDLENTMSRISASATQEAKAKMGLD